MTTPHAIGYLNPEVSGVREEWDKAQIRRLATKFGYDLGKILVFGPDIDQPIHRVRVTVSRTGAEAVFTPSAEHFQDHEIPADLVQVADVVTVNDEHTYARYSTGALPEIDGA